jgi:molecular chaperone DnaK (HSP70)
MIVGIDLGTANSLIAEQPGRISDSARLGRRAFCPEELSALILRALKEDADPGSSACGSG